MIRPGWTLFLLAAASAVLAAPPTLDIPEHSATLPKPRDESWIERHELIKRHAARNPVDLVFLGDSIVHQWMVKARDVWEEYYGERDAVNFGCGGDRTEQILWRIDDGAFDDIRPSLVVLQVGTNNTRAKHGNPTNSAQEIADGVAAIVLRLRTKLPQARILVLGMFPRGIGGPQLRVRRLIAAANEILEEMMAGQDGVVYLDISNRFTEEDGTISREVMADYLHPTRHGYRIWAAAIEDVVKELLGDEP